MAHMARLITPDGKSIELTAKVYRQVKHLLETQASKRRSRSRVKIDKAIHKGLGLLAGSDSLTQALLDERAADLSREEAKFASFLK